MKKSIRLEKAFMMQNGVMIPLSRRPRLKGASIDFNELEKRGQEILKECIREDKKKARKKAKLEKA